MPTTACPTCSAVLPLDDRAIFMHREWHDSIAAVAIESTKRIEALEHKVEALLNERRNA